jgi:transcription elongation factor GreA
MEQQENAILLTAEGAQKLRDELAFLRDVRRPDLAQRLHDAIKQGDLSENADYTAAKEEQGFLEGRILELERMLRNVKILGEEKIAKGEVGIGSKVTVVEKGTSDDEVFLIVGRAEADARHGKVSNESPLGQALLGKRTGDSVKVSAPAGVTIFVIKKVE